MANMVKVAATSRLPPRSEGASPAAMAVLSSTKANSPPAARVRPVSIAARVFSPISRAARLVRTSLIAIRAAAKPRIKAGWAVSRDRSRPMPTDRKNRPSSRPLNGSMVTSTSCRYSVSASNRPAMKAPMAMDRPARALISPAPITTSRQAARNISSLLARATDLSIGRRKSRPTPTSTATPMTAGARASSRRGLKPWPWAWASTLRVTMIGATARSWNNSTEKAARPASACSRWCSAITGITTAVEDRARAAPRIRAADGSAPATCASPARAAAQTASWIRPRPNTSRRMSRSRSHDSSSPIMNSRNTTPNSARSAISSGRATVIADSQGRRGARAPRPDGPSTTPAPRKPSMGLIFRRLNKGATTPAVARNSTRSL